MLPGGGILPHGLLSSVDSDESSAFNQAYKNLSLKAGTVIKRYEKDDKDNVKKMAPEYDVLVLEQNENSGIVPIMYKHCMKIDAFGSIADFMDFKYRPQTKQDSKSQTDPTKQDGAMVILLCINGQSESGLIVGGIQHPKRSLNLDKAKGLHLEGEYNGLNWSVDKDGALKIQFKSATDSLGKPSNKDAGGSIFSMEKDGSIEVSDVYEKIRLDKTKKTISTFSRSDTTLESNARILLKAKDNIDQNTSKDWLIKASGSAKVEAKDLTISIGGPIKITGQSNTEEYNGPFKAKASSINLEGSGAKLSLQGGKVALGGGSAELLDLFDQLLDAIANDLGNLGYPQPSAEIAAQIKSKLASIKGSL
jgi:hypothetical protein